MATYKFEIRGVTPGSSSAGSVTVLVPAITLGDGAFLNIEANGHQDSKGHVSATIHQGSGAVYKNLNGKLHKGENINVLLYPKATTAVTAEWGSGSYGNYDLGYDNFSGWSKMEADISGNYGSSGLLAVNYFNDDFRILFYGTIQSPGHMDVSLEFRVVETV